MSQAAYRDDDHKHMIWENDIRTSVGVVLPTWVKTRRRIANLVPRVLSLLSRSRERTLGTRLTYRLQNNASFEGSWNEKKNERPGESRSTLIAAARTIFCLKVWRQHPIKILKCSHAGSNRWMKKCHEKKKRKSWNFRGKEAEIGAEILYMYKTRRYLIFWVQNLSLEQFRATSDRNK